MRAAGAFATGVGQNQRASVDGPQEQHTPQMRGAPPGQRHASQRTQRVQVHDDGDPQRQAVRGDFARRPRRGFKGRGSRALRRVQVHSRAQPREPITEFLARRMFS